MVIPFFSGGSWWQSFAGSITIGRLYLSFIMNITHRVLRSTSYPYETYRQDIALPVDAIFCNQVPCLNTLAMRQNGRHFPDNNRKCIFLNKNEWILVPINNIPALVQIMAWCRSGDMSLSEPMIFFYWRIYASLGLNELMLEHMELKGLIFPALPHFRLSSRAFSLRAVGLRNIIYHIL